LLCLTELAPLFQFEETDEKRNGARSSGRAGSGGAERTTAFSGPTRRRRHRKMNTCRRLPIPKHHIFYFFLNQFVLYRNASARQRPDAAGGLQFMIRVYTRCAEGRGSKTDKWASFRLCPGSERKARTVVVLGVRRLKFRMSLCGAATSLVF
jgi:hypothetical protein